MNDLQEIFKLNEQTTRESMLDYMRRHPAVQYSAVKKGFVFLKRTILNFIWKVKYRQDKVSIAISGARLGYLCDGLRKEFNIYNLTPNSINDNKNCMKQGIKFNGTDFWRADLFDAYQCDDDTKLMNTYKIIRRFFMKNKIRLIIITDLTWIENKMCAIVAKSLNIPVVKYEHGAMVGSQLSENGYANAMYERRFWDYTWAWSEHNREIYINSGEGEPDKVRVLGYPYQLPQLYREDEKKRKVVFVGEVVYSNEAESYYRIVNSIDQMIKHSGLEIVYAKHPKEDEKLMKNYISENVEIVRNRLYKEMEEKLIVIGVRTTAVLEAALYGCIAIQLEFEELGSLSHKFDNAYLAHDKKELEKLVNGIVSGKIKRKEIRDYYLNITGNITDKVKNEIYRVIE